VLVKVEITPEPSADERRALEEALAEDARNEPDGYRSEWRRAGIEPEPDGSGPDGPRNSAGAARA
jgi:hypothetical protein